MILPDHKIWGGVSDGSIGIFPFNIDRVQPASYDLTLDKYLRWYDADYTGDAAFNTIDPKSPERRTVASEMDDEGLVIGEKTFILASTVEKIRMPSHLVGRVEGKSSLARMGLFVHVTAGFIDPGFEGHITLELFNANHFGIKLYPNMPIAQISFERMVSEATHPYGHKDNKSKYQNQPPGPVESMYFRNFDGG